MPNRISITLVAVGISMLTGLARGESPAPKYAGQWTAISDGILADLSKDNPKPRNEFEKATAGIGVDRTNGDVYLMTNTMFGPDESRMIVGCPDGLYESSDAGKTWTFAVPLAPQIKILKYGQFGNYAWDPIHHVFYASKMGQPADQYVVK
jgi:hypothetical protein